MRYVVLFAALSAAAAPVYTVVDLGSAPLASTSGAGLNNAGNATGFGTTYGGSTLGLAWINGQLTALGCGYGMAINDNGVIAGVAFTGSGARAVQWNGSQAADLGTLGGAEAYATAINNGGAVAGMAHNASGAGQAFVWTNGVMTGLPVAAAWSSAYDINARGVVAGYAEVRPGVFVAFTWSPEDGVRWLDFAYALSLNDAGAVAGATAQGHAVVSVNGKTIDLGPGFAYAINNAGAVVGHDGERAVLWIDGVRYDLNTLIDPGSGWTLLAAYGLNERGQIVGQGWHGGKLKAFRLDPVVQLASAVAFDGAGVPEPGSWGLCAAGLLGWVVLRRVKYHRPDNRAEYHSA